MQTIYKKTSVANRWLRQSQLPVGGGIWNKPDSAKSIAENFGLVLKLVFEKSNPPAYESHLINNKHISECLNFKL